ncbi:3-methyl-2-oxobutanoate hydroxymethyltransferase [Dehalococcoides mccartyi]|jgi:3-methyl-2-oxobutanoate hydroxymethyltransferase|uniref:3-methyl-2-oxobutanoate hydroxymethyltransferase n=1 Tax=Dehalococcoides mccartyi (strain CBDB1) TaxID=255470 RepID=PANB_DEHMC|nr:3-methyl-2-oxobutanoate hydroxymethyltransferase [Dehalococcoides mccartyi]Q3ZXG0.1 RecName: Full=3-methyl-2-oxobutanoate hydroxymethyltransferase; AltName: Full=Ketopantoate hydroxymethyltransferase; Short=KPHMT [Dehalococcoides mccartyi CBDB1]AII60848.1 3-methyl-2-oxobutanoate hydroxymethyltransferase [Dehalococcoides mccartyi CG5]AOV99346.1 3-methyl-2-oxobutanoate hydroxymethyltransferase [Dehalococcoides mccartyi]AQU05826.1 3-methyl-2-oxobutanoate hydroxymethyltransferase [Dehalococcoide
MRTTISQLKEMKQNKQKIAILTAYDYPTAQILDKAGIPAILVGDSLGMVVLGYDSTVSVTMEDMLHHLKAVVRGSQKALIIADMPFMTYHLSPEQALLNAGRFIQEGGAQAVKLEGGVNVADKVKRIVDCGIPVMGHIGLTPQSVNQLSGFKVQGKTLATALSLIEDAKALEKAGAFAIVLETMPAELAAIITAGISIPTIGIGAGEECDGQVQVISDMLGMFTDFVPKHTKRYADLNGSITKAVSEYAAEVTKGAFPTLKESFTLDKKVLEELKKCVL